MPALLPRVFLNNGSGVFSNATQFFPGLQNYGSFGCAVGDFNEDRMLDVIFAHANGFHPGTPGPCKFYNNSDSVFGTFQQVTGYPFTQQLSSYTVPYWSDFDMDGDMDLFIANGPANGTTTLDPSYKNMKTETGFDTLIVMTTELFAQQPQDGQCYNFIDYDNDGDFDLCLTNYYGVTTRFYVNNNGTYSAINTPFTVATTNLANCWGDYDNDGDLDVIITNDNQITRYYRNDAGTFVYLPGGLTTPAATCGVTNADYDNDGDLDVFFNGVGNNGNSTSVGLYKNDTIAGNRNWINLKLTGTMSNRSAVGSLVRIKSNINGLPVWQTREVNAQNSFQGQNDLRVHFGLGNSVMVDSIIIKWPKGLAEFFTNINADRFYNAVEGEGLSEITVGISQINSLVPEKFILNQNYPNPFNPVTNLEFGISDLGFVSLKVYDVLGEEIVTLINSELAPGKYKYEFDGAALSSGVYFYKLSYGNVSETKRMVLLR